MVAGTGEPEAAQERESRGGAGTGEPGAVLPGAARCGLDGFYRRRYWPCPRMYKSSNLFTSLYLTIAFFTLNLVIKIYKA